MNQHTATPPTVATRMSVELPTTMGLDLSDRISTFHVLRGDGETLKEGKVPTERARLEALFRRFRGCRLVIEVGTHSPWISRLGQECGMEVFVANPRCLAEISKSNRKTDRADAKILADTGRISVERLHAISHRTKQAQVDLSIQRARTGLVRARTGLINQVRGVLKSHGYRAKSCSAETFAKHVRCILPPELEPSLGPMLQILNVVNAQILAYEKRLEQLERTQAVSEHLQAIPGIGTIGAVTFALTVDDPTRFKKSRQMGAYIGAVPRKQDSGESSPELGITKAGDSELRRLLVLSSQYILGRFGPDCDLRRYGQRIAGDGKKKAAKKRAVIAVARKLAVLMHHLWVTGDKYDPFHLAKKRGEPVPA